MARTPRYRRQDTDVPGSRAETTWLAPSDPGPPERSVLQRREADAAGPEPGTRCPGSQHLEPGCLASKLGHSIMIGNDQGLRMSVVFAQINFRDRLPRQVPKLTAEDFVDPTTFAGGFFLKNGMARKPNSASNGTGSWRSKVADVTATVRIAFSNFCISPKGCGDSKIAARSLISRTHAAFRLGGADTGRPSFCRHS